MQKDRQLKITPILANGALGTSYTYPVGCEHKMVSSTHVRVYHPDDINPNWTPDWDEYWDEYEKHEPKYLCAYAEFSCRHGMVIEYIDSSKESIVDTGPSCILCQQGIDHGNCASS